ncbi:LacI family DNA-binding transcriptional regulator [Ktedonobacter racemifer]|uniref:Transcriptional regulator, LacI family n=1 Tax=Ktedonobacter racemifer DSM 44963 TaxID=485913 RepID=D6TUE8_KTERA|nr:LacI family DNA-binding transcriptional regulator [Ktedonobacter racemifer]EFH84016.1 transcriptional regulator, LacI family [Ktedonobacter racemifer DSM 44963]
MATIRDIAKETGLGVGTISRVLNSTGYVSQETREKVMDAIKKLQYTPNGVARALAKKRTMIIGVVVHDLTNPFVPGIASGISDEARRQGYTMMLLDTLWQMEHELNTVEMLRQQLVDGVILLSPANANVLKSKLSEVGLPLVVIDHGEAIGTSDITVDHYKGAMEALQWALECGHRRIGFLAGPPGLRFSDLRLRAYLDAMNWQHLAIDTIDRHSQLPIAQADFRFDKGISATEALLQRHPELTCIFAANDLSALGALHYLAEHKIAVPEEVAVIGFDDIPTASLVHPPLTTIHQPIYEMGAASARLLLERIQGVKPLEQPEPQIFELTLIKRKSC